MSMLRYPVTQTFEVSAVRCFLVSARGLKREHLFYSYTAFPPSCPAFPLFRVAAVMVSASALHSCFSCWILTV